MAQALTEHPGDPEAQALACEAAVGAEIAARYDLSLARDRAHRRFSRGEPRWDPEDGGEGFIQTVVAPAGREDPDIARALRRRGGLLDPAGALGTNAALLDRARTLAATRPAQSSPVPPAGPTREEVLALIAAASSGVT